MLEGAALMLRKAILTLLAVLALLTMAPRCVHLQPPTGRRLGGFKPGKDRSSAILHLDQTHLTIRWCERAPNVERMLQQQSALEQCRSSLTEQQLGKLDQLGLDIHYETTRHFRRFKDLRFCRTFDQKHMCRKYRLDLPLWMPFLLFAGWPVTATAYHIGFRTGPRLWRRWRIGPRGHSLAIWLGLEERRITLVSADAWALLCLGLAVTNVAGNLESNLGARGWPGWLKRVAPDWFPPPELVLWSLPFWATFLCGVALIAAERRSRITGEAPRDMPVLCRVSIISVGLVLIGNLMAYGRWYLFPMRDAGGAVVVGVCFLPLIWFLVRRLRPWQQHAHCMRNNLCRQCGYNLTGNVSGICPECGTKIVSLWNKAS